MPIDHGMTSDSSRFLALLRPLEPELETYARRLLWAPQQAPAAIQSAVLRAFTAFGRYREQGSFRAWIFRILTREVWALNGKHAIPARAHVSTDLAKTACAIERHRLAHGELPTTLADLVPTFLKEVPRDLIRGQPLVYRRLEDQSFLLYSLGWNGVDNGGQPATDPDAPPDVIAGDWVWPSTALKE